MGKIDPNVLTILQEDTAVPTAEIYLGGGEVELLLGMTCPRLHQQISMYVQKGGLAIMETRFGQTIVGRAPKMLPGNDECGVFNSCRINIVEENDLWRSMDAETAGIKKDCSCSLKTDEQILFESSMKDAWWVKETGRFEVKLPCKVDPNTLSNNWAQAINRSIALEHKLSKDLNVLHMFNEQVKEMISLGVLKKVDSSHPKCYLPLLAVVNLEKESTKVRVCLNSKTKFGGLSLNDVLLHGKYEINDIFQTIMRFRSGIYKLIGDIRKMFWQIKIVDSDQKLHCII